MKLTRKEKDELLSDLYECECPICANVWWVPKHEGMEDMCLPACCPFCCVAFTGYKDEDKEDE